MRANRREGRIKCDGTTSIKSGSTDECRTTPANQLLRGSATAGGIYATSRAAKVKGDEERDFLASRASAGTSVAMDLLAACRDGRPDIEWVRHRRRRGRRISRSR